MSIVALTITLANLAGLIFTGFGPFAMTIPACIITIWASQKVEDIESEKMV